MALLSPSSAARRLRQAPVAWLLALAILAGAARSAESATAPSEYQVKAVFLFRFAQFVEWPASAFRDPQAPLVIGILGADPFGSYLDETVRGERVNDRPLEVRRYRRIEDVDDPHVLFISRSESARLGGLLSRLKGRHILVVGDADRLAELGGMIQLATERSHIRLKINLDAARAADLTLSSKLLRPAEIVTGGNE